jgi:tRNA1(Val) A37 N6-methylase TrmN6
MTMMQNGGQFLFFKNIGSLNELMRIVKSQIVTIKWIKQVMQKAYNKMSVGKIKKTFVHTFSKLIYLNTL